MSYKLRSCILVFLLLLGGISCQSPLDNAGKSHKLNVDKLKELANYSNSRFNEYSLFFTAALSSQLKDNHQSVTLSSYQLSDKINLHQLNLLVPSFKYKYICNPTCYYLVEYEKVNEDKGTTLLSSFYDNYEFELFKLYSQLFILNDKITILEKTDKNKFKLYIKKIIANSKKYNSLAELTDDFNRLLSPEKFNAFIIDSKHHLDYVSEAAKENVQWSGVATNDNKEWTQEKEQQTWAGRSSEQDEWQLPKKQFFD